jgi:hypothetical protein
VSPCGSQAAANLRQRCIIIQSLRSLASSEGACVFPCDGGSLRSSDTFVSKVPFLPSADFEISQVTGLSPLHLSVGFHREGSRGSATSGALITWRIAVALRLLLSLQASGRTAFGLASSFARYADYSTGLGCHKRRSKSVAPWVWI